MSDRSSPSSMMRTLGTRFLPVLVLLLSGCSEPAGMDGRVMSAEDSSFAYLLADLYQADAGVFQRADSVGAFVPDATVRDSVLEANGLTEEDFVGTTEDYVSDPELLVLVYNLALDVASRR